jgi:16S rRNA U516 pseudouridylate synthase RsuA-like enzyme
MTNLMKVPHTVVFEAIIDLDKIESRLLPALINLTQSEIEKMCKGATLHALQIADVLTVANEGNYWAELTIKEGN